MHEHNKHHSPHDLSERIFNTLARQNAVKPRNLEVETSPERVTLRGSVASWYEKQLAQELLRDQLNERQLHNELEVANV